MDGIKYKDGTLDTTNLLDYSTWTIGQTSATGFTRIGNAYENLIVSDVCPHGEIGPIWQAFNTDIELNADGGWTTSPAIDIDNSKTYRFSVWWKNVANATADADGSFYHRVYGYNSSEANVGVYNRSNGAVNTNAFFYYPYVRELEEGTWYLVVGHIFPAGSGTGSRHEDSGLYTKYGGKNESVSTLDFIWHENGSKVTSSSCIYYSNNPSTIVQFAYPRIEVVDGTEPTINQLLNGVGGYPVAGATQDGNFYVRTSGDMGPSEKTHYWSMIPVSGTQYALYGFDESVNKPRITVDPDSQSFITRINNLTEESITTISEAIAWVDSNSKAYVDFIPTVDTDIYIDPTNVAGNRDGSIENPYNSFTEAGFTSGNVYRLKAGTEITMSSVLDYSGHTATFVGRYGTGADPKIKSTVSGTCAVRFAGSTSCVLDHVEGYTDLTNSLITFIQMGTGTAFDGGTGNVISNCFIHHVKQGSADGGMGIRGGGTNLSVINTMIEDCGCDGMYLRDVPGVLIDGCGIYRINQNYAGSAVGFNSLGNGATGDSIQLDGLWNEFIIRNTTIDRSDPYTGNKFCVIFNSGNSSAWSWGGIVEHCTFKTNSVVPYAVDQVMGTGIIYRYNTFLGSTIGVRLEGANVHDTLFHHNVFIDCTNPIRIGYTYSGTIGPATGTMVYNNVFYMSIGTGGVLSDITLDKSHVDTCNNIHYNTNSAISAIHNFGSGVIDRKSNNCYYGGITSGFGGDGVNPVFGNPAFVDAANGDFHIGLTSACRNAGIDVGLTKDYDGIAIPQETYPAIGAYEYI